MSLRVYVAAPHAKREQVRAVHEELRGAHLAPSARWADGSEDESRLSKHEARALAQQNDEDVGSSHCLLVLGFPGEGGEMFAEVARALDAETPVVWVGRTTLSTHRRGVVLAADIGEAIVTLQGWAQAIERRWPTEVRWGRSTIWNLLEEAEYRAAHREAAQ